MFDLLESSGLLTSVLGAGVGKAGVGGGRGGKGSESVGMEDGRGGLKGAVTGVLAPELASGLRSRLPDLVTGGGRGRTDISSAWIGERALHARSRA